MTPLYICQKCWGASTVSENMNKDNVFGKLSSCISPKAKHTDIL